MGRRDLLFFAAILAGAGLFGVAIRRPFSPDRASTAAASVPKDATSEIVGEVDRAFERAWAEKRLRPASPAPALAVMRRLSLALTGSIPSLEQVRRFEAWPAPRRLESWLEELLSDRRSADYLAERLARAFVGTEDGPFIQFRRNRLVTWLGDAIGENRPYDRLVRDLIADSGLWTDHPATNFITVTFDVAAQRPDPERLAARTSRAFLGLRLDCAQCHDHPFQPWKQQDFRGLAAFFGGVYSGGRGVQDGEDQYRPSDRKTKRPVRVEPRVPFAPELLPASGPPRRQLAAWVVDPRNPNLARATTNRVWALMFGRPLAEPIDDLPASGDVPPALRLLADDFSSHGYDLRRLIRAIAATRAFRMESAPESDSAAPELLEESWAVFPLTRLRPEQVAGALFQADSLSTLDARWHWFLRLVMYAGRNDFVRRYGDAGEDEFDGRSGTIPQRLLLMNGDIVREKTKDDGLAAAMRIASQAPDDARAVESAYLVVLTRRPSPEESAHFRDRLRGSDEAGRKQKIADLCWTLMNATEFSWNH